MKYQSTWGIIALCCFGVAVGAAIVIRKRIIKSSAPTKLSVDARDPKNAERVFRDVTTMIRGQTLRTVSDMVLLLRGENIKRITVIPEVISVAQREIDTSTLAGAEQTLWSQLIWKARQLTALENRRRTAFSEDDASHAQKLESLWRLVFGATPFERRSEKWSELGFQGMDPTTDFRGGGMLALDHFHSFAEKHMTTLQEMIAFNEAQQSDGETSWYLTAVVSIQFTVQLLHEKDHPFFQRQLAVIYDGTDRLSDDGLCTLHHQLLLHFKKMWHKDKPHVMEYNTYMPKVFGSFFTPQ